MTEVKKIVLFGDGCIGKSTLFHKLDNISNDDYRFPKKYKATENFDFKRLSLNTSIGNIKIDLWDTAGQENEGGKMRDAYLKGADGVLLLYDVTERRSIDNIHKWIKQINKICPGVPIAIIGNKVDKLENIQQSNTVRIRDSTISYFYQFRNFLVSIKEDIHLETKTNYFWSGPDTKEISGCLVGLDYVLSNLYHKEIKIEY